MCRFGLDEATARSAEIVGDRTVRAGNYNGSLGSACIQSSNRSTSNRGRVKGFGSSSGRQGPDDPCGVEFGEARVPVLDRRRETSVQVEVATRPSDVGPTVPFESGVIGKRDEDDIGGDTEKPVPHSGTAATDAEREHLPSELTRGAWSFDHDDHATIISDRPWLKRKPSFGQAPDPPRLVCVRSPCPIGIDLVFKLFDAHQHRQPDQLLIAPAMAA